MNNDSDIVLLLPLFLLSIHIVTQRKSIVFPNDYFDLLDETRKISVST